MSLDLHTVAIVKGSVNNAASAGTVLNQQDRLKIGFQIQVATVAGSGAGASVTTAVAFSSLPVNSSGTGTYGVIATPNQDAVAYVTNKATGGFSLVLNPRLASATLAAGTVDLIVFA